MGYTPVNPGKAGAYTHSGTGGQTAGYGYLTYAPKTQQWSTWYGASWGTHSGYAMHTYNENAPDVAQDPSATYASLHLDPTEIRNRQENWDPTDHHRLGTGDHQAGGTWNYHTVLGDIGLLKHTHGGVYMQQYGLQDAAADSAFDPTKKHSHGRVYLYK